MQSPSPLLVWLSFLGAAFIWGTSFLWIKVALREIPPYNLVFYRLWFATLALWILFGKYVKNLPRTKEFWIQLVVIAVFSPLLPFLLITWGETKIDSSVASVLNGTVPVFGLVFAAMMLPDEPFTLRKFLGILGGFVGIVVLFSRELRGLEASGSLLGQLAVLLAAACYAMSSVLTRLWFRDMPSRTQAVTIVTASVVMMSVLLAGSSEALVIPREPMTWFALAWLGILGTGVAFVLYYFAMNNLGAGRATLVNYLFPPIGLLLGLLLLNEPFHWSLVAGMILVSASVLLVKKA